MAIDRASTFAEAFAREGLTVWWDATRRSGEAYDEVTEAIEACRRPVMFELTQTADLVHWCGEADD